MIIEKPISILVQRRAAIGDVIMSTGVVRELKRQYGDNCTIDVATDFLEPYQNNPHVRYLFPYDALPRDIKSWDICIDLDNAYEFNPLNNYLDSYFYRAFGRTDLDRSVELFESDSDRITVDADLERIADKFIVVHMRNWHWAAKNVSLDVWFSVYEKLFTERTDFTIVCAGGLTDHFIEAHPNFYDVRGRYTVQQLKYLCDHAQAFVGLDSAPYWCAAASRTHIIALLTHLRAERILPYNKDCTAIATLEDCHGCNDDQARPVAQLICKKNTTPCTSNFDTDAIANAILSKLK